MRGVSNGQAWWTDWKKGTRRLYCGRPRQRVTVDLVGPMPLTPRRNRWTLVIRDHFTRWQDSIAIADATAPTVAKILDERIFCYFGVPGLLRAAPALSPLKKAGMSSTMHCTAPYASITTLQLRIQITNATSILEQVSECQKGKVTKF